MQVKIANSDSEYRCLNKSLDKMKQKIVEQANLFTLSYKTPAEKGKHVLMSSVNVRNTGAIA